MVDDTSHGALSKSSLNRRSLMKASGALLLGAGTATSLGTVSAQEEDMSDVSLTFVHLDDHVPALLHEPTEETDRAQTAFVLMHPDSDFLDHSAGMDLAKRGYRVLLANSHSDVKGGYHLHDLLPDLGRAVHHLQRLSEVENVVIAGHSGGAHLSAFYQNVAENGVSVCQGREKIFPCPNGLSRLPAADGLIILDGHLGYGPKALIDLGAHIAHNDATARVQSVDMYSPYNGFRPDAASEYSDEFLERWFHEQADRMEEMRAFAQDRQRLINSGDGDYPDDEPFDLVDIKSRVYKTDPRLFSHTQGKWPLLRATGETVTGEQVPSVRGPKTTDSEPPIYYHGDEVMPMTIKRFLSTHSIRTTGDYRITEDSIEGIDYSSTNANTPGNLETVSVPLLIMGMTGHYFVVQSEIHMNHAGSSDKTLVYIEGASHGFTPIDQEYGDTEKVTYDQIDSWTAERFVESS